MQIMTQPDGTGGIGTNPYYAATVELRRKARTIETSLRNPGLENLTCIIYNTLA